MGMENVSVLCKEEVPMDLPPGFRFHPTDEELITHYLYRKVTEISFSARAIGEVDLNRSEPWDLPCKFKAKTNKFSLTLVLALAPKFFKFMCMLFCYREGQNGRERMVLFLCERQKVPNRFEDQQGH